MTAENELRARSERTRIRKVLRGIESTRALIETGEASRESFYEDFALFSERG